MKKKIHYISNGMSAKKLERQLRTNDKPSLIQTVWGRPGRRIIIFLRMQDLDIVHLLYNNKG